MSHDPYIVTLREGDVLIYKGGVDAWGEPKYEPWHKVTFDEAVCLTHALLCVVGTRPEDAA